MCAFHCGVCGRTLQSESSLAKHARLHGDFPLEFKCPVCASHFNDLEDFDAHVLKHEDPARFECGDCKRLFVRKQSLTAHRTAVHSGITYACATCSQTFGSLRNLHSHMFVHTEPMFGCDMCDRRFSRRASQALHIKDHTVGGRVACLCCRKTFALPAEVLAHVCPRRGLVARLHECPVCSRTYETHKGLRVHMDAAHGGPPETSSETPPEPASCADWNLDG